MKKTIQILLDKASPHVQIYADFDEEYEVKVIVADRDNRKLEILMDSFTVIKSGELMTVIGADMAGYEIRSMFIDQYDTGSTNHK